VSAFLLVMVVSFFYATNYMGYYRIFLGHLIPAQWLDTLHSVFVLLMPAVYLFFSRQLVREYRPKRWMMRVLWPFQGYFLVGFLLLVTGHELLALELNLILALVAQLWVCLIFLGGINPELKDSDNHPPLARGWALLYSAATAASFGVLLLPALGMVDATETSLYRNMLQAAVPFVFMAVLVHKRNRQLDRWQQRQVARAEQTAALEKNRREDSEQFLAMLTHEIRTPLTVMAYATKTDMPEGALGEHVKSGIREIDDLIERCIQADRADQVNLPITKETVTVERLVDNLKKRFNASRIQWRIDVPVDLSLSTDVALLEVVLSNLLDNALKYSNDHVSIAFIIAQDREHNGPGVVFTVSNPPGSAGYPDVDRLFDKYYRAPRAHVKTGSGLGLYVARSFAVRLGGQLTYHPTACDVCLKLWLPL
jgi:signal transduction histidine kinase